MYCLDVGGADKGLGNVSDLGRSFEDADDGSSWDGPRDTEAGGGVLGRNVSLASLLSRTKSAIVGDPEVEFFSRVLKRVSVFWCWGTPGFDRMDL